MKLLALETTDKIASVAYYCDGKIDSITLDSQLRHAETVLPSVDGLLEQNGTSIADMDAFCVDVGPGSFTGVRIGVTMANAFASATGKPVIGVNSLEALAYPARRDGSVCAVIIDANNGNGYAALYDAGKCLIEPCACVIEEFLQKLPKDCVMVGTGTSQKTLPDAQHVALAALNKEGQKAVSPEYLRPSQAERMWKGK
ncbi:MAG: tRNA (adenosine(37)-N6)-threonylcarbamoyltransferase complex dimerization subunit type 1 TsaB [Eubacteriales bacterium]|nr:tRNA (adenosine(37)-N6)-threonylcarbamoyltransferase complex dimerization subunit type 1 TsaB [Eubacteriales bacterium]